MAAVRRVAAWVKPGSQKGPLVVERADAELEVYLRERPVEGAANQAAQQLIAKYYGVPKTRVRLIRGQKSRQKLFEVG